MTDIGTAKLYERWFMVMTAICSTQIFGWCYAFYFFYFRRCFVQQHKCTLNRKG